MHPMGSLSGAAVILGMVVGTCMAIVAQKDLHLDSKMPEMQRHSS